MSKTTGCSGHTLVLIDAGCELAGYAADITRTFPVSGRFSPAATRGLRNRPRRAAGRRSPPPPPAATFMEGHDAAVRVLTQGLIDLKLLAGRPRQPDRKGAYKRWYMHRTGHWLGLDVHDAGEYKVGEEWAKLQPGMTLTVEPGLYIRPGDDIPLALAGIGIRIEDELNRWLNTSTS
jgi:Xaa-Pro aminopeptidase